MTPDDDLPPNVRAAIDAERAAAAGTPELRRAIRARIGATVGIAIVAEQAVAQAAATSAKVAGIATTGKVVASVVVAALAVGGVVVTRVVTSSSSVSSTGTSERPPRAPVIAIDAGQPLDAHADAAIPVETNLDAEPEARPSRARAKSQAAAPTPPPTTPPAVTEPAILAEVSVALARGDAEHALVLVDRHARTFPAGVLAEEREALRIRALLALARTTDARRHATEFVARYPRSIHRSIAERALVPAKEPPP